METTTNLLNLEGLRKSNSKGVWVKSFRFVYAQERLAIAAQIVKARLETRGLCEGDGGLELKLVLEPKARKDSYRIVGGPTKIEIIADSLINVIAGCGAFMRYSRFENGGMVPTAHRGYTTPDCEIRSVYLSHHFHNYFHAAPINKVFTYIEDMALWGFNVLVMHPPFINLKSFDSEEAISYIKRISQFHIKAKTLGMKNSMTLATSQTVSGIPESIKAKPLPDPMGIHGNSGNIVCVSNPEGQAWLDRQNRTLLQTVQAEGVELDYVSTWPYDEGGCGCEKCHPWGANGYLRAAKRAIELAREFYPTCQAVVSTWTFDTPYQGEWEALTKTLQTEPWCDIILADSHGDYPRYPLDHGVPGDLPLISFPEISMWALFPWGGYGAVVYPNRITKIWQQTEGRLLGERLYSEGICEDLNKATVAGLCEDYNRKPEETLAQYARYELGCNQPEKFIQMVNLIEESLTYRVENKGHKVRINPILSDMAYTLSKEVEAELPEWGRKSWRWRILAIRALLDMYRYRGDDLVENEETLAAMHELIEIFHCLKNGLDADPYHERVRPVCPEYED